MPRGNATKIKVTDIGREVVEATTSIEEGETHPTTTIGVASTLKVVLTTMRPTNDPTTTAMAVATGCMAILSSTMAETTTIEIDKASIKVHAKLVRMVDLLSPQVMVAHQREMQTIKVRKEPTNDDNCPPEQQTSDLCKELARTDQCVCD